MASGDLLGEEGRLADDPGGDQPLRRTSGMTGAATISNYVISFVRLFVFEMCSSLVMSVPPLRSSSMKAISSGDGSRRARLGSWAAVQNRPARFRSASVTGPSAAGVDGLLSAISRRQAIRQPFAICHDKEIHSNAERRNWVRLLGAWSMGRYAQASVSHLKR
jgi:hypothetical protein